MLARAFWRSLRILTHICNWLRKSIWWCSHLLDKTLKGPSYEGEPYQRYTIAFFLYLMIYGSPWNRLAWYNTLTRHPHRFQLWLRWCCTKKAWRWSGTDSGICTIVSLTPQQAWCIACSMEMCRDFCTPHNLSLKSLACLALRFYKFFYKVYMGAL